MEGSFIVFSKKPAIHIAAAAFKQHTTAVPANLEFYECGRYRLGTDKILLKLAK
jgi:hypothetical protein